jgi:hypothetical protein
MPRTAGPSAGFASVTAILCAVLLVAVAWFLRTPDAQIFNERVFGRYYTAGMLMMLGFYGATAVGLVGGGLIAAVLACVRREMPPGLRWSAVAASLVGPMVAGWLVMHP